MGNVEPCVGSARGLYVANDVGTGGHRQEELDATLGRRTGGAWRLDDLRLGRWRQNRDLGRLRIGCIAVADQGARIGSTLDDRRGSGCLTDKAACPTS
ncbi:MAG: hypothetical protein AAFQ99_12090, partial [Pseudomonadota bacterium]